MTGPDEMGSAPSLPTEFSRLRELRQKLTETRELELEIPGYQGELVAVYRVLDWEEVRKIMRRVESKKGRSENDRRELYAQIDTLIAACNEIKYRASNGQLASFATHPRWDQALAEILDIRDATTARAIVMATFNNDMAIMAHHGELYNWMVGENEEVGEEALGES